jgi:hypothetical protein
VLLAAKAFQIVHEPIALVLGVFEMNSDMNCFFGAYFLTITAKDATEFVDIVHEWYPVTLLVFPRHL